MTPSVRTEDDGQRPVPSIDPTARGKSGPSSDSAPLLIPPPAPAAAPEKMAAHSYYLLPKFPTLIVGTLFAFLMCGGYEPTQTDEPFERCRQHSDNDRTMRTQR